MPALTFIVVPLLIVLALYGVTLGEPQVTLEVNIESVIMEKKVRSVLRLVLFTIAGSICIVCCFIFDSNEYPISYIFNVVELIVNIVGVIAISIMLSQTSKDCLTKRERLEEEDKKRKEADALKQKHFDEEISKLRYQYGNIDKIILLEELVPETAILAFVESKTLYLQTNIISFDKITGCSLLDNSEQITTTSGSMLGTTSANSSNVIGRSIAGGLLGGAAGAVIGGATASTETNTQVQATSTTRTHHHYSVKLQIADIADPIQTVDFAGNEALAYEFVGLVNAILSVNKLNK